MKRFLGGQGSPIAARAPNRADYEAITRYLAEELERLNVDVKLNTAVDPDLIAEIAPDVLIVATGSEPRREFRQVLRPAAPLPGADSRHVYTSWDVLGVGGRATVGARALVYDDTGTYEPLSVAETLMSQGAAVTYVTRFPQLAAKLAPRPEVMGAVLNRLSAGGIDVITNAHLTEITLEDVELDVAGVRLRRPADTVALVGLNDSNNYLADPEFLGDFAGTVHVIGDASGERTLTSAIHGGAAVGRSI